MEYIYGDETKRQGSVIVDEFPFMLDKENTIALALIFSQEVKDEASHPWDRTFIFSYIWECLVRKSILNV